MLQVFEETFERILQKIEDKSVNCDDVEMCVCFDHFFLMFFIFLNLVNAVAFFGKSKDSVLAGFTLAWCRRRAPWCPIQHGGIDLS